MLDRNNNVQKFKIHRKPFNCPVCEEESHQSICVTHLLDHFTLDPLVQRKLFTFLSNVNNEKPSELPSIQTGVFRDFVIEMPIISENLKCVLCVKLLHPKNILNHLLTEHLKVSELGNKQECFRLWIKKLFKKEDSTPLYNSIKTDIENSVLLEKLHLYRNSTICKYCNLRLRDSSSLLKHLQLWHLEIREKFFNCLLCNFTTENNIKFIHHVYVKHLRCVFCRKQFSSFQSVRKHTKVCHQQKGHKRQVVSVVCPMCKHVSFTDEESFKRHIQECKPIPVPRITVPNDKCVNFVDIKKYMNEKQLNLVKKHFRLVSF